MDGDNSGEFNVITLGSDIKTRCSESETEND